MAKATWGRLPKILPFQAKPSGMTMTRWDFLSHSRTRTVPDGLIYAYVAIEQALKGNFAMAIMYSGYSIGNVGLWMIAA